MNDQSRPTRLESAARTVRRLVRSYVVISLLALLGIVLVGSARSMGWLPSKPVRIVGSLAMSQQGCSQVDRPSGDVAAAAALLESLLDGVDHDLGRRRGAAETECTEAGFCRATQRFVWVFDPPEMDAFSEAWRGLGAEKTSPYELRVRGGRRQMHVTVRECPGTGEPLGPGLGG